MDFLDIVNEKMNDIEYGWIDKDGNRHKKIDGFRRRIYTPNARPTSKKQTGSLLGSS